MQSDGPPSTHGGVHGTSGSRQPTSSIDNTSQHGTAQAFNRPAIPAEPPTNPSPWYGGQHLPTGQFSYPQVPSYGPGAYPIQSYASQPPPDHQPNLPRQNPTTQYSQPQYPPQSQFFPAGPIYSDQQLTFDPTPDFGHHPVSDWTTDPVASSSASHPDHQQFAFNAVGPGDPALDIRPPSSDLSSSRPFTTAASGPPNPPVDLQYVPVPNLTSPPDHPPRLSPRRRGGSAAPAPASKSSELVGLHSSLSHTGQSVGSSSLSPTSAWPDQSSTAASFSGSFHPSQYQDGYRRSTSSASQPLVPKHEIDIPVIPMNPLPDGNAPRRVSGASRGKRKSEGSTRVTEDEEDEDDAGDTVAERVSRVDKRRNQNKLAQRAFRARTKVQNGETHNQIAHLIEVNGSQSRRLDEMTSLVARLQKENLELRLASVDAGRPANQHTNPPWTGDQTDDKPS